MNGDTPAILRADWPAPPRVHAFTTLRHGAGVSLPPFDSFNLGVRAGDDPEAVASNRAELTERFALPSPPCWLRQVHGTGVCRLDGSHVAVPAREAMQAAPARKGTAALPALPPLPHAGEGRGEGASGFALTGTQHPHPPSGHLLPQGGEGAHSEPEADAAVTRTPGIVLAILTADCLPVVFATDDGSVIGAAHAGWRGLAAGVLEATVAAMPAAPDRVIAWLGPAAGPRHYEVGEEVFAAFVSRDPQAASAFSATRPGHWRVDLYALARQRLASVGVHRVSGGGLCTISDARRFYSHRRDQRTGRMATLIWFE